MLDKELPQGQKEQSEEIDLHRLFAELLTNRWLITGITGVFAAISLIYVIFATPVYKSTALIQVEKNAGNSLLTDISSMLPDSQPQSDAEIELIQSRMVVGKTVQDLGLETQVTQEYFPIFGKGWARLTAQKPAEIALSRLSVPDRMINEELVLTVLDDNHYLLESDGDKLFEGQVGKLASADGVTLLVSGIKAEEGTKFSVVKRSELRVLEDMGQNLTVADKGKDTGVLGLNYTGEDPVLIKKILSSISHNYLQQNVERKSEEAAKSLKFLEQQLPLVRFQLDEAENKLNAYREEKDSVDLSLEAKSLLDTVVGVESQLNQLTLREAEISQLYTKDHPAYRSLMDKRKTLQGERDKLNKRISAMPATQQEILRLNRDVQAGQEIYMALLNKQQELSISKASTIGNVRIVDDAVTLPNPIAPKRFLLVFLVTIIGAFFSAGIVFLKVLMHRALQNPNQLEEIGINVYASIPISEMQQKKDMLLIRGKSRQKQDGLLLAEANPADLAIEAIRSLRTSLHFAMLEAKNKVVMISGASPEIGKTFVCANLAAVIAQSGERVLLIDADMRRGRLHEVLSNDNQLGLSAVLSGQTTLDKAISKTEVANLDFLPRGKVPPNPSELLMHERFAEFVKWAAANYDMVLIDSPPILAVTDASIIGRLVGTSMIVARYNVTTLKEVEVSVRRFENSGVNIKGVVFNAQERKSAGYYGYGYYNYSYESKND
ncbi:tyrosine-protein kinase Wzc [Serratia inhibens]|uniref:tyrosine-protein kinase Wzc n=1 Tax=Serratia inhibens TaxID=2338073 RepID=UPI00025E300C|nr:tyrosine-protein kinase Wzc [Serratia inhibens]ANS42047.1 Tyrosine-protein kinase wzc [Serratia inhibens PRI-2C]